MTAAEFPRFGEIAAQLVANGYRPLPIVRAQKNPMIEAWQRYAFQVGDERRFDACSTGLLMGHGYIAIDIDVREPDAAAKLEAVADRVLGKAPRRVGQHPKSARLYGFERRLPYLSTKRYRMPDDAPDAKAHRVEVLTEGKQLVCYGQHPDTGRAYQWNGVGDPLSVPVSGLPMLTETAVRAFIAEADELLAEFGEPIQGRTFGADTSTSHESSTLGQRAADPQRFREALESLPNDYDRDGWVRLAHSIKAALGEEGWPDFEHWCQKSPSYTGRDTRRVWESLRPEKATAGTLLHEARARGWTGGMSNSRSSDRQEFPPLEAYADEPGAVQRDAPVTEAAGVSVTPDKVTVDDFRAYMPTHEYIFVPSRELWAGASVNARCESPKNPDGSIATKKVRQEKKDGKIEFKDVPISPSEWLDKNRAVEQMTWAPGLSTIITDRLVSNGGFFERTGCNVFNLYLPSNAIYGDATKTGRWLDHVRRVFPADVEHIVKWLAHRVQRPAEKINHALVLGGLQGIGKDTILEPIKYAVGPWNFNEVSPQQLLGRFNGFVKSVILRISEARDLGDVDRYSFYDHTKVYTAAPPDVLRCDEKNLREHSVVNVCGVIITSNHKADGIYLPADDRRHYVAWSMLTKDDFSINYWQKLWQWYAEGGMQDVAAYLDSLDLTGFDPKAPPPKTPAFWDIVDASRAPEDAELADVLDSLGHPEAVTLTMLDNPFTDSDFRTWLQDRRNRRQIPHRLEAAGYVPVRNNAADDGLWKIGKRRQTVYARKLLSVRDQIIAANELCKQAGQCNQ